VYQAFAEKWVVQAHGLASILIGPQDEVLMLPLAWSLRKVTTLA
jgi:hypothetical protein